MRCRSFARWSSVVPIAVLAVTLFAIIVTTTVLLWLLRRASKAARFKQVQGVVSRLIKPVRVTASVVSLLVVLGGAALLGFAVWRSIDLQEWVDAGVQGLTWEVVWILFRSVVALFVVVEGRHDVVLHPGRAIVVTLLATFLLFAQTPLMLLGQSALGFELVP